MNIANIFSEAQRDLISIITEITPENVKEIHQEMDHYLTFLNQATLLRDTTNLSYPDTPGETSSEETTITIQNDDAHKEISEPVSPTNIEEGYRFSKKLKGGMLENTDIFVPETVVRSIGLQEGDIVLPLPKEPGKYYFDLIQKNPNPKENKDIVTISFGKVEEKDGILIVAI